MKNAEEEEMRRVLFLQKHHALMIQRQKIDIEKRNQDLLKDAKELLKKQQDIRNVSQKSPKDSKPQCVQHQKSQLPSIYTDFHTLDHEQLKLIVANEELRKLTPLNSRGKYHIQKISNRYPIAGTQLKLEKEREMFVSAKKKLLLTMDAEKDNRVALKDKDNKAVTEVEVPYRKFNFYMDNMVEFLKKEQSELDKEANHREIRLAQSTNSDGIQAFWKLFHTSHPRDVVVWLRTYLFEDINVPVMTKSFANGKDSMDSIVMQLHRHKDLGRTPLMAACEKVSLEIVEALLEQNANVKLTTSNGDTALHFLYKTLEQQQQKLEEESNRKTKVQQMNHSKIIFFKRQLQISHEILKLLLQKEPSVANATNLFGETPLHYCTRLSLLESCLLLLEQNANIDFKDRQGKSPIEYAKEKGHNELIRILLNHQTINKIRQQEEYRRHCQQHFAIERGSLSTEWSSPIAKSLKELEIQKVHAGHFRGQYLDRQGNLLVHDDEDVFLDH